VSVLAVAKGLAVMYGVLLVAIVVVVPMVVTALKRQWLLFVAGWLALGLVWWIAAFRLARPDSWWAHRFYDDDKLARARRRYPAEAG
jgi:hypothetical protein